MSRRRRTKNVELEFKPRLILPNSTTHATTKKKFSFADMYWFFYEIIILFAVSPLYFVLMYKNHPIEAILLLFLTYCAVSFFKSYVDFQVKKRRFNKYFVKKYRNQEIREVDSWQKRG